MTIIKVNVKECAEHIIKWLAGQQLRSFAELATVEHSTAFYGIVDAGSLTASYLAIKLFGSLTGSRTN